MGFSKYLEFANENPFCYLATSDGGQPRVRAFKMWTANERGFHFITLAGKSVCKQMKDDPQIEVCFYNNKTGDERLMMRVAGCVQLVDDADIRNKAFESRRARILRYATGPEDHTFEVFSLSKGEAFFWTFDDILKEDQIERVRFG